ncbi:MAG TPA: hypothetical protein VJ521_12690, partial [Acidobacteriota bacterium]|nr:hypothetical protein [Acidobacteriota bacterium]
RQREFLKPQPPPAIMPFGARPILALRRISPIKLSLERDGSRLADCRATEAPSSLPLCREQMILAIPSATKLLCFQMGRLLELFPLRLWIPK